MVHVHKEEIIVGKKEGPSETVLMTEPVIQPGEGAIEHEEHAGKENSLVNTVEDVLRDFPPVKEILVKQEWIELCE